MTTNGYYSASDLLKRCERRYLDVDLPDGGKVRIQSLSESEASDYESYVLSDKGRIDKQRFAEQRRRLLVKCLVDGDGERLFSDDDASSLEGMDGRIAETIYRAASKHTGVDSEDAKKNSNETPGD